MTGHSITHDKALQFIFGGKSIFTVKNTETDNRFTFKVNKHKTDDIFFVRVLTNPDCFEFIGSIKEDSFFKHSFKSRIKPNSQSVKVFDYIIKQLRKNTLPEIVEIWHEGKCGRCGRRLTVPESIDTGFGPECSKMIQG